MQIIFKLQTRESKMLKLQPSMCQTHPQSKIDILCFEAQCKQYAAICHQCQLFDHQNHQTIQIKKILREMLRDLQPRDEIFKNIAKIDSYYYQFKVMLHPNDCIKEQFNNFFTWVHKKINSYHEITQEILKSSKIDKKFIRSLLCFHFYEKTQENCLKTNYELFLQEMIELLQSKLQEIRNNIKDKGRRQSLLLILTLEDEKKSIKKYKFSKTLKNASIKLAEQDLNAVNEGASGNQVVLVEPMIKKKGSSGGIRSIKFKVNQTYSWTSVGVAFGDVLKKFNYAAQTTDIGSGLIAVSNSGYAFHHTDPAVHNSYLSWTFQTGDILKVTVKPASKIITFERQATQSSVDLPYTPEFNDQIYFCVILSYTNESYNIIN